MTEIIETFYAVDYDRCLGDFDANVALLREVAEETSNISGKMLLKANEEVMASGRSFRLLEYLEENDPDLDSNMVQKMFIQRAQASPGSLLEPGALELIEYLRSRGYPHCIMSFGDEKWQNTKIIASGLSGTKTLIVEHEKKSHIISGWWDEDRGYFVIPGECFSAKTSKMAREVVLIDDKPNAFLHLPRGERGYLVCGENSVYASSLDKLPPEVKRVNSLKEIIVIENRRKSANQEKRRLHLLA